MTGALLLLLTLLAGGCVPGPACFSSLECPKGEECVHWKPWDEDLTYCAKTCPVEADVCDDGQHCGCSDSPLKQRCYNGDNERIGVCGE